MGRSNRQQDTLAIIDNHSENTMDTPLYDSFASRLRLDGSSGSMDAPILMSNGRVWHLYRRPLLPVDKASNPHIIFPLCVCKRVCGVAGIPR